MMARAKRMSEPRAVVSSVEEILPGLFHGCIADDRIGTRSDTYLLAAGRRVVLVDPLPIEEAVLARLGTVDAIVLGTASHQRSAWRLRRSTGAPVHAPGGATGLLEATDAQYGDGDALPGELCAVEAAGPAPTHHALHLAAGPGVLFVSDLLMHDRDEPPRFLAEPHMQDPARGRLSARRLLDYRFDVLCFGHGAPILAGGRKALEVLLERDGAS
jgi:hypothetical protein